MRGIMENRHDDRNITYQLLVELILFIWFPVCSTLAWNVLQERLFEVFLLCDCMGLWQNKRLRVRLYSIIV